MEVRCERLAGRIATSLYWPHFVAGTVRHFHNIHSTTSAIYYNLGIHYNREDSVTNEIVNRFRLNPYW
jgi:hypothetical protein